MKNKIFILLITLCIPILSYSQILVPIGSGSGGSGNNTRYYYDSDRDGYGNPNAPYVSSPQSGYVTNNLDCNDNDNSIYPNAIEICDGKDNDCDGQIDEGPLPGIPSTPSVVNNCGNSRLTKTTSPSGITWYWQSSASGTSTSNSSSSIIRSSGNRYYLRARNNSTGCWSSARTVNYSIGSAPSIPNTPSVSNQCGRSILSKGSSPSGITWYWQSGPSGISTSNSSSSITRTSGNRYYLRARNNSTGCWSSVRTVNYSVKSIPSVPNAATVVNNCGNSRLTKGSSPSGITWYWQSSASGTSTSNSSSSITRTSGNRYYLRARNNISGCWSSVRTVSYSIKSIPSIPSVATVVNNCGNSRLTKTSSPSGITWYWQSSASGTSTSNSSSSITRTSGNRYYLRAKNNSTGCWSSARTVSYSIKSIPSIPSVATVVNNCGNSRLTKGSSPSGITWYWQSSASGTSTSNSSSSITRTSGSVYYLRAKNNSTGCWSSARTVNYSIKSIPSVPSAATVVNNCGNSILTKGSSPSGITWYWQSSASGTSTSNSSSSITRTSGSVYYLRAKNNSTGCWSSVRTVNYSIKSIPSVPSAATVVNNCGNSVLTKGSSPSGITWYWQSSASGTSTTNSSSSITRSSGSIYYLRAKNNSTGCWSSVRAVNYSIGSLPVWYADVDGDGLGDVNNSITACNAPSGYVSNSSDQCPSIDGQGSSTGCLQVELSNENYVYSVTPQVATTNIETLTNSENSIQTVTYFDGLGRAKQSVGIHQSPTHKDIVTHIAYDSLGRQTKEFLPYADTGTSYGSLKNNAGIATQTYYQSNYSNDFSGITNVNEINAFSEKKLEPSPLNRIVKQAAPGKDWKLGEGHEIEFNYQNNTVEDAVKLFSVTLDNSTNNSVYVPTLVGGTSNYGNGKLYKIITKDENHNGSTTKLHTTEEFKNKTGQVILKRTYALVEAVETAHDTYYIYDDLGNLTYVLPPKVAVTDGVSLEELSELCYQYKYDYRNRLVEKKIPGKGWEYIIYDNLDRPVLTQDANLRVQGKWLFTKYDRLGRVAYTGMYVATIGSRIELQNIANTYIGDTGTRLYELRTQVLNSYNGTSVYYSNLGFPSSNRLETYTINYYDAYVDLPSGLESTVTTSYGETSTTRTKGLATVSKVKVLETDFWITTVTYYDEKARPIYVYSHNAYLGTTDIVEFKLDFVGRVEETTTTHKKTGKEDIVTVDVFEYDHVGRLLNQQQTINEQTTEIITTNNYDELGQLAAKKVGGNLQTVDYKYNVRGWLRKINDDTNNDNDLFNFEIKYNDPSVEASKRLYNGNIAQTSWQTNNIDKTKRGYVYSYDALNRLTAAIGTTTSNYNLKSVAYDKNGNITNLWRKGQNGRAGGVTPTFGDMDILHYYYNGNKLRKVLDNGKDTYGFKDGNRSGDDYSYDANGNMKSDANKGITNITYNHLNLPTRVTIGGENIDYTYDASGIKLRKVVENTTTDYAGKYIYEENDLQFFNQAEGYIKPVIASGSAATLSFKYVYQYKDHLGNVRLSYTDANKDGQIVQSEIIEESNYYPFGLKQKGYNNIVNSLGNSTAQKFGYNGKELNEELGIQWHDFGARNYNASLGRWMNIDPLAEEMRRWSPYNVSFNNPLRFIDPDGMKPEDIIILFYTKGNNKVFGGGDQAFKAAAETRKNDIENKKSFNKDKDIVLIREIKDISDVKKITENIVSKYSDKYGKTSEVGIWSHSGPLEGPMGTEKTSENAADKYQMALEGWGDIDFNWKDNGISCNLYGCNTGRESYSENSFAEKLSGLSNFENVEVSGQSSSSYPSFKPYIRSTNLGRGSGFESVRRFSFSIGKTYMIGGAEGQGGRAHGTSFPNFPKAKPFNTYKNSKFITTGYSPNR